MDYKYVRTHKRHKTPIYPFIFHYVEDYPSLKECIVEVEESLSSVNKDSYGIIVVMVLNKQEDIELMPTYHSKYFIGDKELFQNRYKEFM